MEENDKIWFKFLRKHYKEFSLFVIIGVVLFISAVYVLLWFVSKAQATDLIPSILGLWSMGYVITFLSHLIFWEFVFVGIPALILFAGIYMLWWKKLPKSEREEYNKKHLFSGHSKKSDAGRAVSFLIFVFFVIKIYLDTNWGKAFATWEFNYLIMSILTAFIWIAIFIGIPVLIGGSLYLRSKIKKQS